MHVLIITPNYGPDLGPSAPLFTMLSKELVKRGHKVTVITAVPHYPSGQVPEGFRGKRIYRTSEDDVEVIRVGLPSVKRENLKHRFFQFICFQLQATLAAIRQKCDTAIIAGPAIQVWLPFTWMTIFRRKEVIFSVHDVYPDVGIRLGIFKNKFVIAVVTALERFCLLHATTVRILSDSFRPGILNLGVPESKIRLVYDWVDTYLIRPISRDSLFAHEFGLLDYFVVLYAGNIGLSQGLEQILIVAQLLASQHDIRFVIVGDGAGKESLQASVAESQLTNVQFIPFQPRERLPEVLACADISMVILRPGIGQTSLPSKTFSIMASGRPIIVSVDEESETCKLIKKARAGIWVPPEDPSKLAEAILALKQDKDLRTCLGENGRDWTEKYHSPKVAAEQFEKLLLDAFQNNRS